MVAGNLIVDEIAGQAAQEARLAEAVRNRVLLQERKARLVRMRILRATLDSMAAEDKDRCAEEEK
eukprot:2414038-Pyramimonas_sp.AAC.1